MSWFDLDLGNFDLGTGLSDFGLDSLSNLPALNAGDFNLNWGNGGNWWDGMDFKLPADLSEGGGDPQTGWPTGVDFSQWQGGGPTGPGVGGPGGPESGGWNWDKILDRAGKVGALGKTGFDVAQGIERMRQMADYNRQVQDYYKAQKDYIAKKQQWESDFMNQFQDAKSNFEGANAEFQGQIGEAQGQAQEVLNQFLGAAKPLLAQSQELLVPAVAALTKGETPAILQPIMNEAKQRAMAASMQSMIAAGMSPDEARAAAAPMVDQMAHQMLLAQVKEMVGQGT